MLTQLHILNRPRNWRKIVKAKLKRGLKTLVNKSEHREMADFPALTAMSTA
jgi:hypothetical protein